MPGGAISQYAFLNAKIRGKMSRLLTEQQIQSLVTCQDVEQLIAVLRDSPYRELCESVTVSPSELERLLVREEAKTYGDIRAISRGSVSKVFSVLESWYEMEDLKSALRSWVRGEAPPIGEVPFLETSTIPFEEIVSAESIEQIVLLLRGTPYGTPITAASARFGETSNTFFLEIALDQDYYRRLWAAVEGLSSNDRKAASRLIGIEIDLKNLQWMLRALLYYKIPAAELLDDMIPYGWRIQAQSARKALERGEVGEVLEELSVGPYGDLSKLWAGKVPRQSAAMMEVLLWEILLREIRTSLAGFPFTIATPLAYCVLKRVEIQNIARILQSVSLGISPEEIESNLVRIR